MKQLSLQLTGRALARRRAVPAPAALAMLVFGAIVVFVFVLPCGGDQLARASGVGAHPIARWSESRRARRVSSSGSPTDQKQC